MKPFNQSPSFKKRVRHYKALGLSLCSMLLLVGSLNSYPVEALESRGNNYSLAVADKIKQLESQKEEIKQLRLEQTKHKDSIEADIKSIKEQLNNVGTELRNHPADEYSQRDAIGKVLADQHEQLTQNLSRQQNLLKEIESRLEIINKNETRVHRLLKKYLAQNKNVQSPQKNLENKPAEKREVERKVEPQEANNPQVAPKVPEATLLEAQQAAIRELEKKKSEAELNHKELTQRREELENQIKATSDTLEQLKQRLTEVGEQLDEHPADSYNERDAWGNALADEHSQIQQQIAEQNSLLQHLESHLTVMHRREASAKITIRHYQAKLDQYNQ